MICRAQYLTPLMIAMSVSAWSLVAIAEEGKQLGGPVLTAFGAEKAGNKEGTIPPYTGEGLETPPGFGKDSKDPYSRPDPYANEKPLYSITAQNAAQYADKLDGIIEVFKIYPNFRMDIYPSHRSAVFPQYVLDNTLKNVKDCKSVDNDTRIENCWGGTPFPVPQNGAHVMWNHLTAYRGHAWQGYSNSYVVATNGTVSNVGGNRLWQQSPYYDPKATAPAVDKTVYWAFRADADAPTRKVGEKLVIVDPLDVKNLGRRAYQYIPGQRRVKLSPDLAYDTPSPSGGGSATMDDALAFSGALDRYDFKLVGKKEKLIMANNFKIYDRAGCDDARVVSTRNFPNPDCIRWELRRVWAVEAKLKPGLRHVYPRRMFYWDEDGYALGLAENYDAANKLYRVVSLHGVPYYAEEKGGVVAEGTFNLDLQTGVWSVQGIHGNTGAGAAQSSPKPENFFSSEGLTGTGIR